jgi:putative endonuclease
MANHVYIIRSAADGTYYVGMTGDLAKRLVKHNSGATVYTRSCGPWVMVYTEEHPSRTAALRRERQIKKRKSRYYLEELIRSRSVDATARAT